MWLALRLQTLCGKLCHLDQTGLVTELDKMLNQPGKGHSFHWSLKKAIHSYIKGSPKDEIDAILNTPTRPAEQKYNKAAYGNFLNGNLG